MQKGVPSAAGMTVTCPMVKVFCDIQDLMVESLFQNRGELCTGETKIGKWVFFLGRGSSAASIEKCSVNALSIRSNNCRGLMVCCLEALVL